MSTKKILKTNKFLPDICCIFQSNKGKDERKLLPSKREPRGNISFGKSDPGRVHVVARNWQLIIFPAFQSFVVFNLRFFLATLIMIPVCGKWVSVSRSLQDISDSSFKLGKDFLLYHWNVHLVKISPQHSYCELLAKYYC